MEKNTVLAKKNAYPVNAMTLDVAATFGKDKAANFRLYVGEPNSKQTNPIHYQLQLLKYFRGGKLSVDSLESFENLLKISRQNNVSYKELVEYAVPKNETPQTPISKSQANHAANLLAQEVTAFLQAESLPHLLQDDYQPIKNHYQRLANQDQGFAYYKLNLLHRGALGTKVDEATAGTYLELALQKKEPNALLAQDLSLLNTQLLDDLVQAAETGEGYALQLLYRLADAVPTFFDCVKDLLSQYKTLPTALYNLRKGVLTLIEDLPKAKAFFMESAKVGNINARYFLGLVHERGLGSPLNLEQAKIEYQQAADKNHRFACLKLAQLYDYGTSFYVYHRDFITNSESPSCLSDEAKAFYYYRKAADLGVVKAQEEILSFYMNGRATEVDLERVRFYSLLALTGKNNQAENDVLSDEHSLYEYIAMAYKAEKNYLAEKAWLIAGALTSNNREFFYTSLVELYVKNRATLTTNTRLLSSLCEQAIQAGQRKGLANYLLGKLYLKSLGVPKSTDKAQAYFKAAYRVYDERAKDDQNNTDAAAYYMLGKIVEQGFKMNPTDESRKFFERTINTSKNHTYYYLKLYQAKASQSLQKLSRLPLAPKLFQTVPSVSPTLPKVTAVSKQSASMLPPPPRPLYKGALAPKQSASVLPPPPPPVSKATLASSSSALPPPPPRLMSTPGVKKPLPTIPQKNIGMVASPKTPKNTSAPLNRSAMVSKALPSNSSIVEQLNTYEAMEINALTALANQDDVNAQMALGRFHLTGYRVKKDKEQASVWIQGALKHASSPVNSYLQGLVYHYGLSEEIDLVKAIACYTQAAEQGYVAAQTMLGICFCDEEGMAKDFQQAVYWFTQAANQGYARAQNALGYCYYVGEGVPKDPHQAVYWYTQAAEQGNAAALNDLGICYEEGDGIAKNISAAIACLQKSAELGYATAQNNLGWRYENGQNVAKDLSKAVYWYTQAAEQGNSNAQCNLGICYANGLGVVKDLQKAVYWFTQAAEKGDMDAQYNLGFYYDNGQGVAKNPQKAVYWYTQAAEQGNMQAQCSLGFRYDNGQGVAKNPQKAVYWFTQAAEQGLMQAQYNLGVCYENGQGVAKNPQKAVYWYTQAAEQGDMQAQYNLGNCYCNGEGVAKDPQKAVYWYTQAAEQGNSNAQLNLGVCYANGQGVAKNPQKAVYWYTQAAEQGLMQAQFNLGNRYHNGEGVAKDPQKAVYWYTQAAEQGDMQAQFNLGICYENGQGVAKDLQKAVYWYTQAAEQGLMQAQYNLGVCYENGQGVAKNLQKAVYWYTQAAEQGLMNAQYKLGNCYHNGEGVAKDMQKAVYWYQKAAAQGDRLAQENLDSIVNRPTYRK